MVSSHYYSEGDILNLGWVVLSDGENIGRVSTLGYRILDVFRYNNYNTKQSAL